MRRQHVQRLPCLTPSLAGAERMDVSLFTRVNDWCWRLERQGAMRVPAALYAKPAAISARARERQREEMGTLGSGNHYLEVEYVAEVRDPMAATAFGLVTGDVVVSIHCGSRGLGHQVGTEYLREMLIKAPRHGLSLPDRELACAPLRSELDGLDGPDAGGVRNRRRNSKRRSGEGIVERLAATAYTEVGAMFEVLPPHRRPHAVRGLRRASAGAPATC